jgi:putative PEP-CTERM system histidine kinase
VLNAGALSYLICAGTYMILAVLLVLQSRLERLSGFLVLASATTILWALASAAAYQFGAAWYPAAMLGDVARYGGWFILLIGVLRLRAPFGRAAIVASLALAGLLVLAAYVDLAAPAVVPNDLEPVAPITAPFVLRLLMAVAGLVLVENLYRNTPESDRWSIKFLVLALAGLFAYDLFLYSSSVLLRFMNPDLNAARGLINAVVVPLIAVSAARSRRWGPRLHVSRRIAFYSATLLLSGAYLLAMSAAGYYVRIMGGSWGGVLELLFLFGAAGVLLVLLSSGRFRSLARGFVSRHFYSYKYDYREEWLRFIRTLAADDAGAALGQRVIRAVADIVDSPDGLLWARRDDALEPVAEWNRRMHWPRDGETAALVAWLEERQSIIDLAEPGDAAVPAWLAELERGWLVLPLLHRSRLHGVMLLGTARSPRRLDDEDRTLLLTAGRQAASYLAESVALSRLVQAQEFEAFNRRTTFLAHDLKNLLAQLSLLIGNARRHRGNPDFVDDMIGTIESSVGKMRQLLVQLRSAPDEEAGIVRPVDVVTTLRHLLRSPSLSHVVLEIEPEGAAPSVVADPERLAASLRNLVVNAADAAGADGAVAVRVQDSGGNVSIEVRDTGPGMEPGFVTEGLFSPFRTTKGEGYGIGAFESREFARQAGGRLEVESDPGKGTLMRMVLPTAVAQEEGPDRGVRHG